MSSSEIIITSNMDEMEKKLAQYRAKKAREAKIDEVKIKAKDFFGGFWKRSEEPREDEKVLVPPEDTSEPLEDAPSVNSDDDSLMCCSWIDAVSYVLWFFLWVVLYVIFIKIGFGTVFLIVSAIIFMYVNTRTGPKKRGEVSAYSVFNKNCESINGTLKAEQFEREIRYGPSVII